jgi:hypothetical protein
LKTEGEERLDLAPAFKIPPPNKTGPRDEGMFFKEIIFFLKKLLKETVQTY